MREHQRWWSKREDGDTSRQSSREKVNGDDAIKAAMARRAQGLPGLVNASGTKARTRVANIGCARESAQLETPLSDGLAEEAPTTVVGAEE